VNQHFLGYLCATKYHLNIPITHKFIYYKFIFIARSVGRTTSITFKVVGMSELIWLHSECMLIVLLVKLSMKYLNWRNAIGLVSLFNP